MQFIFTVVSKEPWIIHGYTFGHSLFFLKRILPYLCPPKNGYIHFILTHDWFLTEQRREHFLPNYKKIIKKYPFIKVTMLANEEDELKWYKKNGIRAELCNQNALLDENLYLIISSDKKYDAIMNAHMSPYKRIELIKNVHNCCLITYIIENSKDADYAKTVFPLPFCDIPQFDGKKWHRYDINQICEFYAKSRCGVILSAEEGACFAATEYLLCGLPVVTTPSVGGREAFFDPDYVVWTEPTPEAVAEAVQKAISLPISPQEIRERTIFKMKKIRNIYCNILNNIAQEEGIEKNFFLEWDSFFVNKMMRCHFGTETETINYLLAQGMNIQYPFTHKLHTAHREFRIWWDRLRGKR